MIGEIKPTSVRSHFDPLRDDLTEGQVAREVMSSTSHDPRDTTATGVTMTTTDLIREIRALGADLDALRREHDRLSERATDGHNAVDDIEHGLRLIERRVASMRRRLRPRVALSA